MQAGPVGTDPRVTPQSSAIGPAGRGSGAPLTRPVRWDQVGGPDACRSRGRRAIVANLTTAYNGGGTPHEASGAGEPRQPNALSGVGGNVRMRAELTEELILLRR